MEKEKDYILESILRMKEAYTPTLTLSFPVDEKMVEINKLIDDLANNTETGIKFREVITDLSVAYLAKFEV